MKYTLLFAGLFAGGVVIAAALIGWMDLVISWDLHPIAGAALALSPFLLGLLVVGAYLDLRKSA